MANARSRAMKKYWQEIKKIQKKEGVSQKKAKSIYKKRKEKENRNKSSVLIEEETSMRCPYCRDIFNIGEVAYSCCEALYHEECILEFKKCAICLRKKRKKTNKTDLSKRKLVLKFGEFTPVDVNNNVPQRSNEDTEDIGFDLEPEQSSRIVIREHSVGDSFNLDESSDEESSNLDEFFIHEDLNPEPNVSYGILFLNSLFVALTSYYLVNYFFG